MDPPAALGAIDDLPQVAPLDRDDPDRVSAVAAGNGEKRERLAALLERFLLVKDQIAPGRVPLSDARVPLVELGDLARDATIEGAVRLGDVDVLVAVVTPLVVGDPVALGRPCGSRGAGGKETDPRDESLTTRWRFVLR